VPIGRTDRFVAADDSDGRGGESRQPLLSHAELDLTAHLNAMQKAAPSPRRIGASMFANVSAGAVRWASIENPRIGHGQAAGVPRS
jgi:hypothetical protein